MKFSVNRHMPRQLLAFTSHHRGVIVEVISSFFVLLFTYTTVSKLVIYDTFVGQLSKSPFLEKYAVAVGWLIPASELIIALLLVIKRTRLIGLFASFALMLAFSIYIYMMLHYSHYVPCSCGGVLAQMSWEQHLLFNIVVSLLALGAILLSINRTPLP